MHERGTKTAGTSRNGLAELFAFAASEMESESETELENYELGECVIFGSCPWCRSPITSVTGEPVGRV